MVLYLHAVEFIFVLVHRMVGGCLILGAPLSLGAAGLETPPDDSQLLTNVDSLKTKTAPESSPAPLAQLEREIPTLWDRGNQASQPLDPSVVYAGSKDGYKVEGIYLNGYRNEAGQDRIFFYFARPEKIVGRIPAYIDLTGGSDSPRSLWLAETNHCAVIDVEWRGIKNKFRSQWQGSDFDSMKTLTSSLHDNPAYRLITGVRRVIDYLERQPEIDTQHLGCGGGSMGGYYTLLATGVDDRLKFGVDELGAGHEADSDSRLGQFELDPARRKIWLEAFDPYSYAAQTKARIFMNLSADDYFFWLGDGLANYQALPGDKRLCITPNFDHKDGAFGKRKNNADGWLDYGFAREDSFPKIEQVSRQGALYTATVSDDREVTGVTLCWSPGGEMAWPSRYWVEIPAQKSGPLWEARIPSAYLALARYAFMTMRDANGRTVSSLSDFVPGNDPQGKGGPLWDDHAVWDVASGPAAWRLIGPNVHPGSASAKVATGPEPGSLQVAPQDSRKGTFGLVTNSLVLAAGQARAHQGLQMELDGNGKAGVLTVTLVRHFGAVHQTEFSTGITYGPGAASYRLPWIDFKGPQDQNLFPFESLRLDGRRPDGSSLTIKSIRFLN